MHDVAAVEYKAAEIDERFPYEKQFLLEVRGDSMDAATPMPILPGSYIHCVDYETAASYLRSGVMVVVHRFSPDRQFVEATVKRVRLYDDHIDLIPESNNPKRHAFTIPRDNSPEAEGDKIVIVAIVIGVYMGKLA